MNSSQSSGVTWRGGFVVLVLLVLFGGAFFWAPIWRAEVFYVWDLAQAYLPVHVDNARLRSAGEWPLWNLHLGFGYPITAEGEVSGLYPPALLFNVIPKAGQAFTAFILFHYGLALMAMIVLTAVLGIGSTGQATAALSFVFGGSFVAQTVNLPLVTTLAWTPLVLAVEIVALRRGSFPIAALGGILLAVQTIGAHLQITFFTMILMTIVATVQARPFGKRRLVEAGAVLALMVVLGLGLSAPQVLYSLEFLPFTDRGGGLSYAAQTEYSLPPTYLAQLFLPDLFGNERTYIGTSNVYELRAYFGLMTLSLIGLGWQTRGHLALLFKVCFVVTLLLALGRHVGLYYLLSELPGFRSVRAPARLLLISSMCAAVLAGYGADRIARNDWRRERWSRPLAGGYMGLAMVLLALGLMAVQAAENASVLSAFRRVAELGLEGRDYLDQDLTPGRVAAALTAMGRSALWNAFFATVGAGLWIWLGRSGARYGPAVLPLLIAADLFIANAGVNRYEAATYYETRSAIIGFLEEQPGLWRVSSLVPERSGHPDPHTLRRNFGSLYAIDAAHVSWSTPYRGLRPWVAGPYVGDAGLEDSGLKALGIQNVRFIVSDRVDNTPHLRERIRDGDWYLYENTLWMPRIALRSRPRLVSSADEARTLMRTADFEAAKDVAVEVEPRYMPGNTSTAASHSRVDVEEYKANTIRVRADVHEPAILVVADLAHPGWEAYSNGRRVTIMRVNAFVRGLALGPGRHHIEFRYRPRSFFLGLDIACASALGLALWAVVEGTRRWRWRRDALPQSGLWAGPR